MHDHIERARDSERRWLFGNLSGVVGAQNSFVELSDSNTARKLQEMVCAKLGLNVPLTDMSTRTDRFAEITANLAGLCSALGKMGLNIRNWQQTEVMEVEEPYDDKQHSSSTLPNKKNPESSEYIEGLAIVARGLALAMQDTRMPVTRDSTRIPVQYTCIPSTYMLASRALRFATEIISGLIVHKDNMLRNINHPNVLQRAAAERIMIAMYKKTGEKDKAHSLLHKCARQSQRNSLSFREILLSNKDVGKIFSSAELDKLLDLTTYTGTATRQTEETVRAIERKRK
jgi:adenylosuccinate lyase